MGGRLGGEGGEDGGGEHAEKGFVVEEGWRGGGGHLLGVGGGAFGGGQEGGEFVDGGAEARGVLGGEVDGDVEEFGWSGIGVNKWSLCKGGAGRVARTGFDHLLGGGDDFGELVDGAAELVLDVADAGGCVLVPGVEEWPLSLS